MYGGSVRTRTRLGGRTVQPWSRLLRIEALEVRQLLTATAVNDSYSVEKNVALTVSATGILANDTDSTGLTLTASLVSSTGHGNLLFNASGGFTYTPNTGYTGADSFTYTATDGTSTSNVATVSFTVSDNAPVVVPQSYVLNENLPLTVAAPGLLTGASDANGDTLSVSLVAAPANGNVVVSAGGGFTYTPKANYTGPDSFTYEASDGTLNSNVATVSLTVNAVTQPPVSASEAYHVNENGQLVIGTSPRTSVITVQQTYNSLVYDANSGLLYGDTNTGIQSINPQTGALGTLVAVSGSPGPMVISSNGEYIYSVINGGGSVSRFNTVTQSTDLTFALPSGLAVGTISAIPGSPNSVLISMRYPGYSPPAGGTDVFQNGVALPDHVGQGLGTGGPDESFVDPNGVNAYGYDTTDSGYGFWYMTIEANGIEPATPTGVNWPLYGPAGYLAEADGLIFSSTNNAVSLATGQSIGGWSGNNYTLDVPNDKLFSINNNGSTQTIYSYVMNTMALINSLTVPIAGNNADLTRFGQNGLAFLSGGGQTILVQSDLISGDPYRGVLVDNTDPNNLPLTAQLVTNVQHGTLSLNSNGTFTYTPNAGFYGTDSFTYESNNGTLNSSPATITLHVDAPPVAPSSSYQIGQSTSASFTAAQGVLAGAVDPNGYPLSASLVSGPHHGTLTLNSNGSFTYAPTLNYSGADSFTFVANDGYSNSATATVSLTVNAPPTLNTTFTTATFLAGGSTLSYAIVPTVSDPNIPLVGDELQLQVTLGTLTVPTATTGVTIVAGSNGSGNVTIQGSLSQLNAALADMTYTPSGVSKASLAISPTDPTSGTGGAGLNGSNTIVMLAVAPPIVTVSDSGGTCTGNPFPATALVNGAASLEGVSPTFAYYVGSTATGTPSSTPPSAIGTYTVVAKFAGSTDYPAASSAPLTFTINPVPTGATVGIPLGVLGNAGQTVNVPVAITDNAFGLASADLAIDYNPALLTLTNSNVSLSNYLTGVGGWSLAVNVNNTQGVAYVGIFSATGLPDGTPQLLNLAFTVAGNAPYGSTPVTIDPNNSDLYNSSSAALTLSISNGSVAVKAMPTVTASDAGGTYTGNPFPATALVNGSATLEGAAPTLAYYVGSTATGTPSSTPPSAIGTYTVVANFPGSPDYAAASSNPVTFSIVPFAVTSFAQNSTGFTFQLNAAPNLSVLNLYSGNGGALARRI